MQHAWRVTMNSLHSRISGLLAAGCVGLMLFCSSAFAQFVSREQIVEALTTQPASLNFTDRLRLTRSLTLKGGDYVVASVQPKATIDLHEVFFEFNSAAITDEAKPQLRERAQSSRSAVTPMPLAAKPSIKIHRSVVPQPSNGTWWITSNCRRQIFIRSAMESGDQKTRRMYSPLRTDGAVIATAASPPLSAVRMRRNMAHSSQRRVLARTLGRHEFEHQGDGVVRRMPVEAFVHQTLRRALRRRVSERDFTDRVPWRADPDRKAIVHRNGRDNLDMGDREKRFRHAHIGRNKPSTSVHLDASAFHNGGPPIKFLLQHDGKRFRRAHRDVPAS
jgi:hypothetical protein